MIFKKTFTILIYFYYLRNEFKILPTKRRDQTNKILNCDYISIIILRLILALQLVTLVLNSYSCGR